MSKIRGNKMKVKNYKAPIVAIGVLVVLATIYKKVMKFKIKVAVDKIDYCCEDCDFDDSFNSENDEVNDTQDDYSSWKESIRF